MRRSRRSANRRIPLAPARPIVRPSRPPAGASPAPAPLDTPATAPETPAAAPSTALAEEGRVGQVLKTTAEFLPPVTVATALLFYFGWARSEVQAQELGIDTTSLDMSVQEYMMRSISSLYLPLGVGAAVLLAGIHLHHRTVTMAAVQERRPRLRVWARLLSSGWLVVPLAALLVEWAVPQLHDLVFPLGVALGVLLTTYAARLRALLAREDGRPRAAAPSSALHTALVGVMVVVALFWEVSAYAGVVGRGLADRVAGNLGNRISVTIYSPKDLQIHAPGVKVTAFDGENSAYGFCYTGLRLLQRSGGKYFLLPDGWTPADRKVIAIADDAALRVEFGRAAPGVPAHC
ncbi:hypothetical protein ABZT47_01550 [Sphaerisporangium sp. NPDC005289]|uniref:hypothetical protein n=1 Tax=Sphaerisporangium sp. NPDC005289 TaxID=3155247 RepID=UPI0033A2CD9A